MSKGGQESAFPISCWQKSFGCAKVKPILSFACFTDMYKRVLFQAASYKVVFINFKKINSRFDRWTAQEQTD